MNKLRIGFLGTGGIAKVHARAILKQQDIEIVALCNHHIDKAQSFATQFAPTATCFDDFGKMLNDVALDALYICLPPGAHCGQTEDAAIRGIHLFLEKPIALTMERANSIRNAVNRAGIVCQIGHHMRHTGPAIELKDLIRSGAAGRPLMFTGRFLSNALHGAWWRNPAIGGGQLVEQAIHIYDLARYFLGDAKVATGFASRLAHQRFADYQVDDSSASTIQFADGGIASIIASNCAIPCEWTSSATVICQNMTVELRGNSATFAMHGGKVSEEIWARQGEVIREEFTGKLDPYEEITRNFLAAIRDNEPLRSTIDDGVKGLELVLAVARSSQSAGRPQFVGCANERTLQGNRAPALDPGNMTSDYSL